MWAPATPARVAARLVRPAPTVWGSGSAGRPSAALQCARAVCKQVLAQPAAAWTLKPAPAALPLRCQRLLTRLPVLQLSQRTASSAPRACWPSRPALGSPSSCWCATPTHRQQYTCHRGPTAQAQRGPAAEAGLPACHPTLLLGRQRVLPVADPGDRGGAGSAGAKLLALRLQSSAPRTFASCAGWGPHLPYPPMLHFAAPDACAACRCTRLHPSRAAISTLPSAGEPPDTEPQQLHTSQLQAAAPTWLACPSVPASSCARPKLLLLSS